MDKLNNAYITLYESDDWKVLVSDSVSTVMRWSKQRVWCTKDRCDATSYLRGGDCVAVFKTGPEKRPYLLWFTDEADIWNHKNDPVKLYNFFSDKKDLRKVFAKHYPRVKEVLAAQRRFSIKQHQKLYWSDEYRIEQSKDPWDRINESFRRLRDAEGVMHVGPCVSIDTWMSEHYKQPLHTSSQSCSITHPHFGEVVKRENNNGPAPRTRHW